jgi:hypothetical protein
MTTFDLYKNLQSKYLQIVNKSWDDTYINFILSHPDKPWDWGYLSRNPNITIDMVLSHPDLPWNWESLSSNPNITMDMVLSHPDLPWDWGWLSRNPNITMEMVLSHPNKPWKWFELSMNPNIPWSWGILLCSNNMKKGKEKYIIEKLYELKVIDEFKLINQINNLFPDVIADIIIGYFN